MPADIWPAAVIPRPANVPPGHKLRAIRDGNYWLIAWTQKGGGICHVHIPAWHDVTVTRSTDCVTCGGGNAVGAWDPRPHLTHTPPWSAGRTHPTISHHHAAP